MYFDESYAERLKHYLAHDSWTVCDAFAIMSCIDPGSEGLFRVRGLIDPVFCDAWEPGFDEKQAKNNYDRLWDIWRSGINLGLHPEEFNPPLYFIRWAHNKNFHIAWLDWAQENGLLNIENQDSCLASISAMTPEQTSINSAAYDRLQRSIEAFPRDYPDYTKRPPKLDTDIRPWLKKSLYATNDREAHVFGVILSEHFKLSSDSSKGQ